MNDINEKKKIFNKIEYFESIWTQTSLSISKNLSVIKKDHSDL